MLFLSLFVKIIFIQPVNMIENNMFFIFTL